MTPHKQAADYAAIAVAPMLIFLMISSLATFLMLILYTGGFSQRVSWTLLCFTMGAVAVARIAIERDRNYALGYAAALGLATFVVMLRFVDSPIFCAFILIVISYLADVIVRDCTLIDDSVDASGQGLIDSGRLFLKEQIETANTEGNASPANDRSRKKKKKKKNHQPGRTVMYLALGALPLFGLGQFFLRNDTDTWARAQLMLAIYLFASLSLLVTTSFLGLRRYLRQRKTEMPGDVTVAWLAGGLALIAMVLLIAYLAPLPGKAIASLQAPDFLSSPGGTTASRFGWGDEGADNSDPNASTTMDDQNAEDKEVHSMAPQEGAEAGDVGDGNREDGPAGKRTGGKKQTSGSGNQEEQGSNQDSKSQNEKSQPNQKGDQSSGQQDENASGDPSSESNKQDGGEQGDEANGENESSQGEKQQSGEAESSENQSQQPSNSGSPPKGSSQDSSSSSSSSSSSVGEKLGSAVSFVASLIKFLIFLVLLGIVASFVWLNRHLFAQWWDQLFASDDKPVEETIEQLVDSATLAPPKPFASFRSPIGRESDLRRVVVITFQAFDAWAREHGTPRGKDETPAEFLRRFGKSMPHMSAPVSELVDAYNRIVYGRGKATQNDASAAEQVWHAMRSQL